MEVSIKNMVCPRCIRSVAGIARECGLQPSMIELGRCVFESQPDEDAFARFKAGLEAEGFEILSSREESMVAYQKHLRKPGRTQHRELLHQSPNRESQGTSALRRTHPVGNSLSARLLIRCASQRSIQEGHRTYPDSVQKQSGRKEEPRPDITLQGKYQRLITNGSPELSWLKDPFQVFTDIRKVGNLDSQCNRLCLMRSQFNLRESTKLSSPWLFECKDNI